MTKKPETLVKQMSDTSKLLHKMYDKGIDDAIHMVQNYEKIIDSDPMNVILNSIIRDLQKLKS